MQPVTHALVRAPASDDRPHVIVIGGGYAGVLAASRVAGRAGRRARITLISDRNNTCILLCID